MRGAVEALLRYLNDDSVFTAIPGDVLERMLGNADTILSIESPAFAGWKPRNEDLATLGVPVTLMIASETLPVYKQVMDWLARQLKTEPIVVAGRHGFYYYRPQDLADVLRRILRRSTTQSATDRTRLTGGCRRPFTGGPTRRIVPPTRPLKPRRLGVATTAAISKRRKQ